MSDTETVGSLEVRVNEGLPKHSVCWLHDDKVIGRLTWDEGQMKFEGDADQSAKSFFEYLQRYARFHAPCRKPGSLDSLGLAERVVDVLEPHLKSAIDHFESSRHTEIQANRRRRIEERASKIQAAAQLISQADGLEISPELAAVIRKRLDQLPQQVLESQNQNPAWSKSQLWGIERDIVPEIRRLCMQIAALLPEP